MRPTPSATPRTATDSLPQSSSFATRPRRRLRPRVFTCAFLLKLLLPQYSAYIDGAQREQIRARVQQVVGLLGSPDVAIDEHSPKRHARWLQGLLDKIA